MRSAAALDGLKVVEFAHIIAGPLAGVLMADLGAEVIHVEDPGEGDPHRSAGPAKDGTHLWWKVAARNKRSVTLNLRTEEGRRLARELVRWSDVVITNFRVSTLERWGLDWASLHELKHDLVMLQVTGYGATSSRRDEPGFGKVAEAMSGVVELTGFPDGPPVHTGFSHGDSVAGLMGAFAVQAALYRKAHDPGFDGEWIDLALYDALYRLVEWQVVVQDQLGGDATRAGNRLAVAPAAVINVYRTGDDRWLTVTSGTPRAVRKVAALLGERAEDYATREQQHERRGRLDALLAEWVGERTVEECLDAMVELGVVAAPIHTARDILEDPLFEERRSVVSVPDTELGTLRMQGVVPAMTNHPGSVRHPGPGLGADNDLVYGRYLARSAERIAELRAEGVI
ncbi:CoA transferase [Pseudonocardia sp. NPDC049154]|uniref:CaiB/BaiF CoA transferase family protein n=1 Tax=Pseudonocardia sp. NPDC049154 TaxID=3155501 RepID=UPI0033E3031C